MIQILKGGKGGLKFPKGFGSGLLSGFSLGYLSSFLPPICVLGVIVALVAYVAWKRRDM